MAKNKKINWNIEHQIVRDSMSAFTWDNAVQVMRTLGIKFKGDDEYIGETDLREASETIIETLIAIHYGVMTLDEARSLHSSYNFWVQGKTSGGNTRYACGENDVSAQINVRVDWSLKPSDRCFEITLVCAEQLF